MLATENHVRRYAAWLVVTLAYLYSFPYFERLNSPNENVRIWTTRAIVDHHQFAMNEIEAEWGWVNDASVVNGRFYSSKAPGLSLLGAPVYAAQKATWRLLGWPRPSKLATTLALRFTCVIIPLTIFLLFFSRYVERQTKSPAMRDLLVLGLGTGTMLYPYGVLFMGHSISAALAFSSYMILSTTERRAPMASRRLAAAGLLAGLSVFFEYQLIVPVMVLSVYAVVVFRASALAFFLGALAPAIALAAYQTAVFGKPWELPQGHMETAGFAEHHKPGFFGLSRLQPAALAAILFAPNLGLFVFSPFLVLGVVGAVATTVKGNRREGLAILSIFTLAIVFHASLTFWRAGWCVGPRYSTVVVPFLAAGIARAWMSANERWRFWLSAGVAGLVIPAVLFYALSTAIFPHYPEQYDNPIFDLALPLLGSHHVPYNLGRLMHLPGAWSLLPLGVVLMTGVLLALRSGALSVRRRWTHSLIAVTLALIVVASLSRFGRSPRPDETRATHFVHSIWQPK